MQDTMKVTVKFGHGNEVTLDLNGGSTVSDALDAAREILGFGENIEARLDGVTQPGNAPLDDGDEIQATPKVGTKAS